MTGTIPKKEVGSNKQVLDKLKVERERGITGTPPHHSHISQLIMTPQVKAQTARYERVIDWHFVQPHTFLACYIRTAESSICLISSTLLLVFILNCMFVIRLDQGIFRAMLTSRGRYHAR